LESREVVEREFEGDFVRVPVERVFLLRVFTDGHRDVRATRSDHRRYC